MKVKYHQGGAFVIQINDSPEEVFQGTEAQAKERTEYLRASHYQNINRLGTRITLEDYVARYIWHVKEVDFTAHKDA